MSNRIDRRFEALGAEGRTALIPFVTAGYPEPQWTVPLLPDQRPRYLITHDDTHRVTWFPFDMNDRIPFPITSRPRKSHQHPFFTQCCVEIIGTSRIVHQDEECFHIFVLR